MELYVYFLCFVREFLLFAHPCSACEPPPLRKNFWHGWILCRCKSYSLQLICLLSEYRLRCAEEQSCFFSLPNWASPQIQMWAAGPVQCLHKHLKCLSHGTQSLSSRESKNSAVLACLQFILLLTWSFHLFSHLRINGTPNPSERTDTLQM